MHKINVYYINTDKATNRRENLEKNFAECGFSDNWTLQRVRAFTPDDEIVQTTKSIVEAKVTGNYLSHVECLKRSKENDDHAFIVEDDTIFGKETEAYLNVILNHLNEEDWDILFTDIYVGEGVSMAKLFKRQIMCKRAQSVLAMKTKDWEGGFGGAGAYIVNRRSKDKLIETALYYDQIMNAYDMALKYFSQHDVLRTLIAFPFLTTVSELGDDSTVFPDGRDMRETILFHYFRRLVWIGADHSPEALEELIAKLERFDEATSTSTLQTRALSAILTPLLALQMTWDSDKA